MKKWRVGIIGTGSIAKWHMRGYEVLQDEGRVEVVAACDINASKLEKFCECWEIPHRYTDCREMMEREQLDCVSVCTWNAAHKECTIVALKGGAHVICEKPMAMNAAEAKEMWDTAEACGKILQIGFVRRFGEDANAVRALTKEGVFGDIYYAKASYQRQNGCPGGWFGDKAFSGGGPLIDLGVHAIDLSRYLAGSPKPVSAYGVTYDNLGPDRVRSEKKDWTIEITEKHPYTVEDLASAMIRFDNGFTLVIEASFNLNIDVPLTDVQLFGTKAGTSLNRMNIFAVKDEEFVTYTPERPHTLDLKAAFPAEIKGFIDACEGLAPCRATAEDGYWLMKIIDAIYESAKTGKSVDIQ